MAPAPGEEHSSHSAWLSALSAAPLSTQPAPSWWTFSHVPSGMGGTGRAAPAPLQPSPLAPEPQGHGSTHGGCTQHSQLHWSPRSAPCHAEEQPNLRSSPSSVPCHPCGMGTQLGSAVHPGEGLSRHPGWQSSLVMPTARVPLGRATSSPWPADWGEGQPRLVWGKVGAGCRARQWERSTQALCLAGVGGSQGVGSEC